MTSQARIDANRRNAQLSTGPRTPEGKAVVATNAIKHGLSGRHVILADEDPQAYDALQSGLTTDHRPQTLTEELLIRRMAQAEWRSQRIIRRQTTLLNADPSHEQPELILLNRYEGTASRDFFRSLDRLDHYRADRRRAPHTNPQTIANALIADLTTTLEQTLTAAQTTPTPRNETNPIAISTPAAQTNPIIISTPIATNQTNPIVISTPIAANQTNPTPTLTTPLPQATKPEKEPRPAGSGFSPDPRTPSAQTNPIPNNPNPLNHLTPNPAKPTASAIATLRAIAQQLRAEHSTPNGNPNVAAGMEALLAALLPQPAARETKPTTAAAPLSSTT